MNKGEEKSNLKKNFYLVLDLEPGCSHNDIVYAYNRCKDAFKSGSLASYSIMDDDSNADVLEEIEEAFRVLGNPPKRREYDIAQGYDTWASEKKEKKKILVPTVFSKKENEQMSEASKIASYPDFEDEIPSANEIKQEIPKLHVINKSEMLVAHKAAAPVEKNVTIIPATPSHKQSSGFEVNLEFEKQIQECQEADGAFLRATRIYRQLSIEQLAGSCKLSPKIIENIENETIEGHGYQPVYLRGHVYMMCQNLGFPNPPMLAKAFLERMKKNGKLG